MESEKINKFKELKILLITSHSKFNFECPHLGLYRLKHVAISKNHQCDIIDSSLVDIDEELKKIDPYDYDIIGISPSHSKMKRDVSLINYLIERKKERKPFIIAGGQEATLNGKQWLNVGIDFILTGYAEESFSNLLDYFSNLNFNDALNKLKNLEGGMYLENDSIIFNPNKCLTPEYFEKYNHDIILDMDIPYEEYWEKAKKGTEGLNFSTSIFIPEEVRLYTIFKFCII